MVEHPIQGLMNVTMEKIHQMVDSNTIIGKPITTEDGITILPVSKVSFGFASGGTDSIDRALTMLPELVEKLTALVKKDDKAPAEEPKAE